MEANNKNKKLKAKQISCENYFYEVSSITNQYFKHQVFFKRFFATVTEHTHTTGNQVKMYGRYRGGICRYVYTHC